MEVKEKRESAIACTSSVPFSKHCLTSSSLKQHIHEKNTQTEIDSKAKERVLTGKKEWIGNGDLDRKLVDCLDRFDN